MMSGRTYKVLLLLLAMAVAEHVGAQSINIMPMGDTLQVSLCQSGETARVYTNDQGGFPHGPLDAWAIVEGHDTASVAVTMMIGYWYGSPQSYEQYPGYGYLTVWAGQQVLLDSVSGFEGQMLTVTEWPVTIHVHYDSIPIVHDSIYPNQVISFNFIMDSFSCAGNISHLHVTTPSPDTAIVQWYGAAPIFQLWFDGAGPIPVVGNSITFSGLQPNSSHKVRISAVADSANGCCYKSLDFHTPVEPANGCFDPTNLTDNCICSYGWWGSGVYRPGADGEVHYGAVDYGPYSEYSRHTVMTNPELYDPFVNILTVCPGFSSSVRLGNWLTGAQYESITYSMKVDTTVGALLTLHYAAVMQDPQHDAEHQPRFTFDILDASMMPIDTVCGHADFVSSANLGWNWSSFMQVRWKNWTSVGVDLTPYHGQVINLRFTTYDCSEGGHFGYAYFMTECSPKIIHSNECGATDFNTFTAPAGYTYLWYATDPNQPYATTQSVTIANTDATFHCRLTSIANPACQMTLGAYVGMRLPKAEATYNIETEDCVTYTAHFSNSSFITADGVNPLATGEHCESAIWYFGDGDTSTDFSPTHVYTATSDTMTAMLVASMADGMCTDTLLLPIVMPRHIDYDEQLKGCDSLQWRDGVTYHSDTAGVSLTTVDSIGCERSYTMQLDISPSYHGIVAADTACHGLPYPWGGTVVDLSAVTDTVLYDTLATVNQCDSAVTMMLHVVQPHTMECEADTFCFGSLYRWHGLTAGDTAEPHMMHSYTLLDTMHSATGCDTLASINLVRRRMLNIAIESETDCNANAYTLTAIGDTGWIAWSSLPADTAVTNHHGSTSLVVSPQQGTYYILTAGYGETLLCPVSDTMLRHPVAKPQAKLRLGQAYLSYEKPDLDAYDISAEEYWRRWTIVSNNIDSIHLGDTTRHVTYHSMPDDAKLTVVLAVHNGICPDTVTDSVPVKQATMYAPNVFTPDRETNRIFRIEGVGITIETLDIYNRWGNLIYRTGGTAEWDGTDNGQPCPQGAYVWHLTYYVDSEPHRAQRAVGTVTLLR